MGVILLAGVSGFSFYALRGNKQRGDLIKISVNKEVFGEYELEKDQVIPIGNTNKLEIKDGYAKMIEADCPDKLCLNQKKISKKGEVIVCLPNKVLVEVDGAAETGGLNGVSK